MKKLIKINVKILRKKYPHPIKYTDRHRGNIVKNEEYCVGGALCQEIGMKTRFPGDYTLNRILKRINPNLNRASKSSGYEIVCANDEGNFEKAWDEMDKALKYGTKEEKLSRLGSK